MNINFNVNKLPVICYKLNDFNSMDIKSLRYLPDKFIKSQPIGSYEDFMQKLDNKYGNINLKKIIRKCKKHIIGDGLSGNVYSIPGIQNYVLKVDKLAKIPFFSPVSPLKKVKNELYCYNFGQRVASNDEGIDILMRCNGKSHSVSKWVDAYKEDIPLTVKEAEYFVDKSLKTVSEFPQETFDDFARKIYFLKIVAKKEPDTFNPNNILIDYDKKIINLVDININKTVPTRFNIKKLMAYPLYDEHLKDLYIELLDKNRIDKYDYYQKVITDKCLLAAKKCGLADYEDKIL